MRSACNVTSQPPGGMNKTGKTQELLMGNLWHLEPPTPSRKRTPRFPSWAWAQSLPGCVHCLPASWLLCLHEEVESIEWNWTLRGQPIQPSCSARGKELL